MSIETVLDVGTEGLSDSDIDLLEMLSSMESGDYDAPRTTSTEYGFVIWIGDEDSEQWEIDDLKERGASKALLDIIEYAFRKEVFMINMDRESTGSVGD